MRRIYLILMFLMIITGEANTQTPQNRKVVHSKGYKSLRSFRNDTLAYLTSNLIDRKNVYVGKELNYLLDDLEVDIKSYMYAPGKGLKVYSFVLMLENYNTAMVKKYRSEKPIAITIGFENPMDLNFVDSSRTNETYEWTNKQKEVYGKNIIRDIHVTKMKK